MVFLKHWPKYHGILTLEKGGTTVNYHCIVITLAPWSQCYKTLIYRHSTVTTSFCVFKQYYDGNYCGMAVSNTMIIYRGISTLEITGIFITSTVNYYSI
jgi:hypothetical protein